MAHKVFVPIIFGLIGVGILASLGFWQIQRLTWKEDLLSRIEIQINRPSVALPVDPKKSDDQYLKVAVEGIFLPGEIHVLTSEKFKGPGFRVIMPFLTNSGSTILVDRGFILEKFKDIKKTTESNFVEGNLLWPDEIDYFTPKPNLERGIWFARDVHEMSEHLKTAPILLIAVSENKADNHINPKPLTIGIPNNHFEYAVTWFSLAIIWFFMTIYFFWSRLKKI